MPTENATSDHIKKHGHVPHWLPTGTNGVWVCIECGRVYDMLIDANNQGHLIERT